MIERTGPALLALALSATAPAAACPPGIAVVEVGGGAVMFSTRVEEFELAYRHSVTLTPVVSRYRIDPHGIVQVEERMAAHGPGVAYGGEGWRREGGMFVLPLERGIDRLVLRAAPQYENRLIAGKEVIDLFRWPGRPLEIRPLFCEDTE